MKTSIDHLPQRQQRELERAVEILHAEFADALGVANASRKLRSRILKIVLFGSYARGSWVDEPHTAKGYKSDFDILIVVNDDKLTDVAEYWYKAEDRLILEPTIQTPVNFIVHSLSEVNNALSRGQYFFFDIVKEGIELYSLKGSKPFITPKPPNEAIAYETAMKHLDQWMPSAEEFRYYFSVAKDREDNKKAAFFLHQATENLYSCMLLVLTNYSPSSHNIKFLRSLCESRDDRLIEVWPRETKQDRARFELLKKSYVEARYSEHYRITTGELAWLARCVEHLAEIVKLVCEEHLRELES